MRILRDCPVHMRNTLIPACYQRASRPWMVPMVVGRHLQIRWHETRAKAREFIAGHPESSRLWPDEFDQRFPFWQMGKEGILLTPDYFLLSKEEA